MKSPTRRALVSSLLGGACLLAATASWGTQTVNLRAEGFDKTLALPGGGTTNVQMWGFALDAAPPSVPGPALTVVPGETQLVINVQNNLTVPISIVIPGQDGFVRGAPAEQGTLVDAQGRTRSTSFVRETAPGALGVYTWNNLRAGTFLYLSGSHSALHVQMGLHGMLKQDAVAGTAYGRPYTNEAVWLFSEVDLDVHNAVRDGLYGTTVKSMIHSTPEFYLLNGEPYQTASLPVLAGQTNLVRLLNACFDQRSAVLNGYHATLLAEDGHAYPYPRVEAAIDLPALKTRDALLVSTTNDTIVMFDRRVLTVASFPAPPDLTPPTLLSATADSATAVSLTFSEAVAPATGIFTINNGVTVNSAAAGAAPGTVVLTTSAMAAGVYQVTVNGLTDLAVPPNTIAPNSQTTFTYTPPPWWSTAQDLGGGWRQFAWFGTFNVLQDPWIYHQQHGWMFALGTDVTSLWFNTTDMGWLWTTEAMAPNFFWVNGNTWLFYQRFSANPRLFFNYTTGQWMSVP